MKKEDEGIEHVDENEGVTPAAGLYPDEWCIEKAEKAKGQQELSRQESQRRK